ncbi:MAG: hypothetical protein JOY85_14075 [Acidobacteriaceae bacterium]|nr:hypothetical protein [Acidobacteriaceae bacterium]
MAESQRSRLYRLLHPQPSVGTKDTSLRYTDILFGFVIRELFQRLSNFLSLQPLLQAHLIVGTILVLGSWIGYRRSIYRSSYEVKFFNIPFFKFLVDQLMLILYFRIATVTPITPSVPPPALAQTTVELVFLVFVLYFVWDVLGLLETSVRTNGIPVYPKVANGIMTQEHEQRNWSGFWITTAGALVFGVLWLLVPHIGPVPALYLTAFILLVYRWSKENRWIWK